jgi:ABC-type sugar transport system substrate-binding protein
MQVKRKRMWLAFVLAMLVGSTLAACGDDDSSGADTASGGGSSTETVKVGVVLKTFNDYFSAMRTGIEGMSKDGIEVLGIVAPGDGTDAQAQIGAIQDMLTRGAQGLVVAPVGPQVQPVLEQAAEQGVKVVLVDNDLPDFSGKTSYVGTDNLKGGEAAGAYIKEQLGGRGTIAIMSGAPGVPALDDRVNGVLDQLRGTDIRVVTTLPTLCDQTRGLNVMQAIGSAHADVDAVYSACGPPVLGAIQARAKNDPFKPGLLLVGFDALPDEAKAILAGDETASVAQFPQRMGTVAVETAAKAARGEQVEARIDTGTEVVTRDNAQRFTQFQ